MNTLVFYPFFGFQTGHNMDFYCCYIIILVIILITAINWGNYKINCWHLQKDGFALATIHKKLSSFLFRDLSQNTCLVGMSTQSRPQMQETVGNNENNDQKSQ